MEIIWCRHCRKHNPGEVVRKEEKEIGNKDVLGYCDYYIKTIFRCSVCHQETSNAPRRSNTILDEMAVPSPENLKRLAETCERVKRAWRQHLEKEGYEVDEEDEE